MAKVLLLILGIAFGVSAQETPAQISKRLENLKPEGANYSDDTARVNIHLLLATASRFESDPTAMKSLESAIRLSEKLDWHKGKAESYLKMGDFSASRHELMIAAEYYYKALLMYEMSHEKNKIALTKRRLGDCYSLLGDYNNAIRLNNESLGLFKQLNNKIQWLQGFNNLALVYHDSGQYAKAIEIFKTGIGHNELLHENVNINSLKINLAISYLKNKEIDNSIDQCQNVLKAVLSVYDKSLVHITLAEAFFKKGEVEQARKYIEMSQSEMSQINAPNDLQILLAEIAKQVFSKTHDHEKELFYTKKYYELNDLKNAQDLETRIRNLKYGYENANQKKTIDALRANRLYLMIIGFLVFAIGTYLFFINTKLRDQKKLIEHQKQELGYINEQLESKVELRTRELVKVNEDLIRKNLEITEALFQGQSIERERVAAELHDNLGGTISSLKWRLEALDINLLPPRDQKIYISIKEMIGNAYNEVRFISHNLIPQALREAGLIGALEKICRELNESEKINIVLIHSTAPGGIILEKRIQFEIYNICLECLNNILKHSEAKIAQVKIEINDKEVKAVLSDNGIGFHPEQTKGKGLQNIARRVDQLNGKLNHYTNQEWSTIFEIIIPYFTPEVPDNIQTA